MRAGLDIKPIQYFSTSPRRSELLRTVVERSSTSAPKVLRVLRMFKTTPRIRIEISTDKKAFDLHGASSEDALKLVTSADAIRMKATASEKISGKCVHRLSP